MCACPFCEPEKNFKQNSIDRVLKYHKNCYVAVPLEPAMEGHLIVVSNKHIVDITEIKNEEQYAVLSEMIIVSARISRELRKWDRSIRKVYMLCEGETPHLHFHLKPRREGEETGDLFLFEKELQESRWVVDPKNENDRLDKGKAKVRRGTTMLENHNKLINEDNWLKSKEEVEEFYNNMINNLKPVVTGAIESLCKSRLLRVFGLCNYRRGIPEKFS